MDLKRLAMLREVRHRGSFAAAAEALSFTPSAVSQQMTALAREIGVALFERTPRGMRVTDSAHALIAHTEAVFARLSDAQAELDMIAGGIGGRLRLGSFPSATVAFTAQAMETFREAYPRVAVTFADGEPYQSVERLKERELDLAVLFDFDHWTAVTDYDGRPVCADDEIDSLPLFDDPFHVVLPADHRLADSEQLVLSDLAGERVLGSPARCSPWGTDFSHLCAAAGFEPVFESCYRTVDFAALQAIVATGRGMTLVPAMALAATRQPGTVVRALQDGPVRHVAIAMLAGIAPSPASEVMTAVLQTAAVAYQPPSMGSAEPALQADARHQREASFAHEMS
ncbi:MAG: LysR family transcriptional regulator [Solirubrobacteraceae bacterium]